MSSKIQTALIVLVAIAVLYVAQAVFIPLALAALLAMLLGGPVQRMERWRVPRAVAVTAAVLLATALLVGIGWLVGAQITSLADRVDEYQGELKSKWASVKGSGGGFSHRIEKINELGEALTNEEAKPAPPTKPTTQASTQPSTQPSTTAPASATQPSHAAQALIRAVTPPGLMEVGRRDPGEEMAKVARVAAATQPVTANVPIPPNGTEKSPFYTFAMAPPEGKLSAMARYLGLAMGPLGTAGIVLVFVFFILLEREDLRDRIIRLVSNGNYTVTTTAVDDGLTRVLKFMRAQAIVNGTYGIAVALGLCAISLTLDARHDVFPSFVIWGLLGAVLRFVPYVGPWVAAAFPISLSLAAYPGFTVFFAVVGMYLLIELLSNNIMEPMLYGQTTGLSVMALLVSAVFWTWLWGPVGLLLSTPLTVLMMVVGRYVPSLRFLEVLLGDAPAMSPSERVYQRLLAGDEDEAYAVADDHADKNGLLAAYDDVVLPALYLSEQDDAAGQLDNERALSVKAGLRRIIDTLGQDALQGRQKEAAAPTAAAVPSVPATPDGDKAPARITGGGPLPDADGPGQAPSNPNGAGVVLKAAPPPKGVRVAVLPAQDEADELAGNMLAHLLRLDGCEPLAISHNALAAEMVEAVTTFDPHAVCISAMPPAAVSHVRYLLRRLTGKLAEDRLAVGVWKAQSDLPTLRRRLDVKTAPLATTLTDAVASIKRLTEHARLTVQAGTDA